MIRIQHGGSAGGGGLEYPHIVALSIPLRPNMTSEIKAAFRLQQGGSELPGFAYGVRREEIGLGARKIDGGCHLKHRSALFQDAIGRKTERSRIIKSLASDCLGILQALRREHDYINEGVLDQTWRRDGDLTPAKAAVGSNAASQAVGGNIPEAT